MNYSSRMNMPNTEDRLMHNIKDPTNNPVYLRALVKKRECYIAELETRFFEVIIDQVGRVSHDAYTKSDEYQAWAREEQKIKDQLEKEAYDRFKAG